MGPQWLGAGLSFLGPVGASLGAAAQDLAACMQATPLSLPRDSARRTCASALEWAACPLLLWTAELVSELLNGHPPCPQCHSHLSITSSPAVPKARIASPPQSGGGQPGQVWSEGSCEASAGQPHAVKGGGLQCTTRQFTARHRLPLSHASMHLSTVAPAASCKGASAPPWLVTASP